MKRLHLFEAVGLVDECLVEEAADAKRTVQPWGKWLAAAACMALVLSLGTAAAGSLLRGCGSKNSSSVTDMAAAPAADAPKDETAAAPMAAPAAEAASEELSPDAEDYGNIQGSAEQQAAEPEIAAGLESEPAEPEEPLPEPAAAPQSFDGVQSEAGMGMLQKESELFAADKEVVITLRATAGDSETGTRQAQYWVENRSGTERSELLHFSLDTNEEGMEGVNLEIRVNGETVPFDAFEATACPTEDGEVPERDGRHFLIEFTAVIPAKERVEVEIQY